MNKALTFQASSISKAVRHSLFVIFVLCFSLGFNLQAQAQVTPPIECTVLDSFELPGGVIELDAGDGNPGPVNELQNGGPGVIGEIRNVTYGPTNDQARLIIEVGTLANNNEFGSTPLDLLYNANGAGLNLDLSEAEDLRFNLTSNDLPETSLEIILTDSENNIAQTVVSNLPNSFDGDILPQDLIFPFSEFSGIGALDLSNIFSIELRFDSQIESADFAIETTEICGPVTRDVPTLSEWGLIAMAGVLGLVSFMVMRRKKALITG